jgi:hypothetical protein
LLFIVIIFQTSDFALEGMGGNKMLNSRKIAATSVFFAAAFVFLAAAHSAYKGHANDKDVNAILSAYPTLKGAAVDSCITCHRSGKVRNIDKREGDRNENGCGYCHAIYVKNKGGIKATLNAYGTDYLAAGRGPEAIKTLALKDSDTDGFANEMEFIKGTNPGESASNPSALIAPYRVYASAEIKKLSPVVDTTVFLNTSHNKAGDFYNRYRGNRVYEMLQAAGISDDAESVDFISYDGFEGAFSIEELKKSWPQTSPVMGLSKKEIGPCGWVNYNAPGLDAKRRLPNANIMLAFEENGEKIATARLDPETGKIIGTGPLRLVVPQYRISPPDLPQYADQSCQEKAAQDHRFNDSYDHNGGRSSFAIIAIRVHPMPKGTRDFEWEIVRDQLVAEEKLVIFGALKNQKGK